MALTFVNQIGAIEGLNQAAPGTLIPETFVRWSQDVLFDRAGLMRRRGPFEKFRMYNEDGTEETDAFIEPNAIDERIIGVFSTYTPENNVRIGMLVNSTIASYGAPNFIKTVFRVFDNQFRFLGQEEITAGPVTDLSVVSAKPALGGGLWISVAGELGNPDTHFQFFWRGGAGRTTTVTGDFTVDSVVENFNPEHGALSDEIILSDAIDVEEGQFVFANVGGNDYYVGVVKSVNLVLNTVTLEKRPFIWDTTIDNNHNVSYTITSSGNDGGFVEFFFSSPILFENGDVVTVSGHSVSAYNTAHTLTTVAPDGLSCITATVHTSNGTGGIMKMDNDLLELDKDDVALKFTSLRPFIHMHGRGLMTIPDGDALTLSSGTVGTSGEGHWKSANVVDWNVYRASDNVYLGKVKSVTDNDTAAFYSDPGATIFGDEYIMHKPLPINVVSDENTSDFLVSNRSFGEFGGLYTAIYAGYQWYANIANEDENVNRVVFSAAHNREAVDLSKDAADSIVFPGKSQFRGIAASSSGLLVFLEDRTYILRGNDRVNFSVEQLVPEGCLCPSSIVEYGGGVFWAAKTGIMFFDGASVRNLTKDNLGLYYSDSLDAFDPEFDRVLAFVHKNNLIMHFTRWKSPFIPARYEPLYADDWRNSEDKYGKESWTEFDPDFEYDDFFTNNNTPIFWDRKTLNDPADSGTVGLGFKWGESQGSSVENIVWEQNTSVYKYGPLRGDTGITFSLYLPTNALTTLSNMDFRGVTATETVNGLKTILGVNTVEANNLRARLVDIHTVFDFNTNGQDAFVIEKLNIPYNNLVLGPDFYLQTKHFTVGDPILRKWFQKVLLSMLLYDGALRMDLIDDDDNDEVDINKKKPRNWQVFTEKGYDWDYLGKGEGDDFGVVFPKLTSPKKSTWENVEDGNYEWNNLFTSDFNRYSKRISWRKPSVGLRLYQLNNYKKPYHGVVTLPTKLELQGFSIGFKPLRQGRI